MELGRREGQEQAGLFKDIGERKGDALWARALLGRLTGAVPLGHRRHINEGKR